MRVNPLAVAARALIEPAANAHAFGTQADITQEALDQLGTMCASELDAALFTALQRYLGRPVASQGELEALGSRMCKVTHLGKPGETWCIDNIELLWAGHVQVLRQGTKLTAVQPLRQLLAESRGASSDSV